MAVKERKQSLPVVDRSRFPYLTTGWPRSARAFFWWISAFDRSQRPMRLADQALRGAVVALV